MLTAIEKVILLQNIDIFEKVPTEQLAYLAAIAREIEFLEGDTVYREQDRAEAMYLVLEGAVRLHQSELEITVARARDAFGTWALFDEQPAVVTATALEDTRLLRVEREDFIDLLADHVQITQGVLKTMAGRLRGLASRVGYEQSSGGRTGSAG